MTKPKTPWRCQKCSSLGKAIPRAYPRAKLCAWCADELKAAGQRWCSAGRHGAPLDDWASPNASMCRACQKATNQAYRAEHRDVLIAQSAAYHACHRAEILAQNKIAYQANRDQLLAQKKVYYAERRELIKAKQRAYRPHRPLASRLKEKARQRAKQHLYYQNEKLAQRRRWLASLRPAATPDPTMRAGSAAAIASSSDGGPQ